ncbi:hypothetical protein M885DRAFT_587733 [Pelagophyceae sp. CCMP2097]|nr:hypothetical protein M885DRAFT_587733 [Pelagophyceae sp. CCMP2097]
MEVVPLEWPRGGRCVAGEMLQPPAVRAAQRVRAACDRLGAAPTQVWSARSEPDGGVITFPRLRLDVAGTYRLRFCCGDEVVSLRAFTVYGADAAALHVGPAGWGDAGRLVSGAPLGTAAPVVKLVDAFGNAAAEADAWDVTLFASAGAASVDAGVSGAGAFVAVAAARAVGGYADFKDAAELRFARPSTVDVYFAATSGDRRITSPVTAITVVAAGGSIAVETPSALLLAALLAKAEEAARTADREADDAERSIADFTIDDSDGGASPRRRLQLDESELRAVEQELRNEVRQLEEAARRARQHPGAARATHNARGARGETGAAALERRDAAELDSFFAVARGPRRDSRLLECRWAFLNAVLFQMDAKDADAAPGGAGDLEQLKALWHEGDFAARVRRDVEAFNAGSNVRALGLSPSEWPLRLDGRFARARCVLGGALSARVAFDDPYGLAVFYEYLARESDIFILDHALLPPGFTARPEATVLCRVRRDGVDSNLELVVDTLAAVDALSAADALSSADALAAAEAQPPAPPELSLAEFEVAPELSQADSDLRAQFRSRLRLFA